MDALSFVVGLSSKNLRGNTLKDLIYKGDNEDEYLIRSASVILIYSLKKNECKYYPKSKEISFQRIIAPTGTSSYKLQNENVTQERYDEVLQSLNILVKARNFLIFQGDVNRLANKKSTELIEYFEEISQSNQYDGKMKEVQNEIDNYKKEIDSKFQAKQRLINEKRKILNDVREADNYKKGKEDIVYLIY